MSATELAFTHGSGAHPDLGIAVEPRRLLDRRSKILGIIPRNDSGNVPRHQLVHDRVVADNHWDMRFRSF
jgi:hypothetical protein